MGNYRCNCLSVSDQTKPYSSGSRNGFWAANLPAVAIVYLYWPALWDNASILYLALVSVWGLVDTAASGERQRRLHKRRITLGPDVLDLHLGLAGGDCVEYQGHGALIVQGRF